MTKKEPSALHHWAGALSIFPRIITEKKSMSFSFNEESVFDIVFSLVPFNLHVAGVKPLLLTD